MNYEDMTTEQKDLRQKLWAKVLEDFCPSLYETDEYGNDIEIGKPCDIGCPCDKCHYDYNLNQKYRRLMKSKGLPLCDNEVIDPCLCGECEEETDPNDLTWVNDNYGNPFKKVCPKCREKVEAYIEGWTYDPSTGEYLEED